MSKLRTPCAGTSESRRPASDAWPWVASAREGRTDQAPLPASPVLVALLSAHGQLGPACASSRERYLAGSANRSQRRTRSREHSRGAAERRAAGQRDLTVGQVDGKGPDHGKLLGVAGHGSGDALVVRLVRFLEREWTRRCAQTAASAPAWRWSRAARHRRGARTCGLHRPPEPDQPDQPVRRAGRRARSGGSARAAALTLGQVRPDRRPAQRAPPGKSTAGISRIGTFAPERRCRS